MKKFIGCVGLLAVAACTQPAALGPSIVTQAEPSLTALQIRQAVAGNTGTGTMSGSHITYSIYIAPDGTAQLLLPTGVEKGSWRLTDDGLWCAKWQKYRGGNEYCQRVFQNGEVYKFVNSNSEELLRFAPGNSI